MTKAKDKKNKPETTNRNSVAKSNYTEEEKTRIAKFVERSRRVPGKFKAGDKSSAENPVLNMVGDDSNLMSAAALETFGTADPGLQSHLLCQVIRSFEGTVSTEGANEEKLMEASNIAMAILNGIQPRDEIEGMLSMQMIATHNLVMQSLAGVMVGGGLTLKGREFMVNQATKMLRTFTAQMEALKKYRTGGQQKVTVEHVHVNEGGQAIVGNVTQGGGGSYGKKEG